MIKIEYYVTIQREYNKLTGVFEKIRKTALLAENGKRKYENIVLARKNFYPTTFLMDLCQKAKNGLSQKDMIYFFGFYERHIPQIDTLQLTYYVEEFLGKKHSRIEYEIEKMKLLTGVNYEYSIWKKGIGKYPEEYVPYTPFPDTKQNIFAEENGTKYVYRCNSINDIIFVVFHYFALHGYKTSTCRHCGKKFLTTNLKNVYCIDRTTPYVYSVAGKDKKYSLDGKNCKEAVKTIKDKFRKRKKKLLESYERSKNPVMAKMKIKFTKKDLEYMYKEPTVDNLKVHEKYLYEDYPK